MPNFTASPGVTGASDYQTANSSIDRRQKFIDALLAQKVPHGQMIGDRYVAPHALETLAGILAPIMGARQGRKLDEERASNSQKYQAGMTSAMNEFNLPDDSGYIPKDRAAHGLTSQYPEVRERAQTEMKKYDSMDTGFMRMLPRGLQPGMGQQQANGGGGGTQSFPVDMGPGTQTNAATSEPSGVQLPPQVQQMFPNLSASEIMMGIASDPSGKQLLELNAKRNAPIVAGNNVFQPMGGGRVGNAPGSVEAMAAVEAAKEAAKAPYGTPIQIPTVDGVQMMAPSQFQQASGAVPPPGAPSGAFQLPKVASAGNFTIPPKVQQERDGGRLEILRNELANERDPRNRAMIEKEISNLPGGKPSNGLPGIASGYGDTVKGERSGLFEGDAKTVQEYRATAQKSGQAMRALNNMEKGLKGGSFQGAYANVQERAAAFFGPLGIKVDATKLTNTQAVKAFVQNLVIPQVKQLGFNPTDADARRIEESVGNIQNDPAALDKIMNVLKDEHRNNIDMFKRADSHLRKNHSLEGFEYNFEGSSGGAPSGQVMDAADFIRMHKKGG